MILYLAGPMRGYPLHNFPAFFKVALALRGMGHDVVNSAEMDMALGYDPAGPDFETAEAFERDFRALLDCEAVVFLPGWLGSEGARAECVVAHYAGKKIYQVLTLSDDEIILHQTTATPYVRWAVTSC